MDDVVLNKAAIIERCVRRIREEHAGDDRRLTEDITRQDSIILNLQRACEAAIDLAMHLVRVHHVGIPQESRDAFRMLSEAGKLPTSLADTLMRMVGFRNVAVHDYRALNLEIVKVIIAKHLDDLLSFGALAVKSSGGGA